jgi:Zn-dependent protease
MYATRTILTFSFAMGRLGPSRLRASFLLPVVMLALTWRLGSISLGLMAGIILLLSLLLHEMAHLASVRRWGGNADEILIWPLGGLSEYSMTSDFRGRVEGLLAGPLVHVLVLTLCYFPVSAAGQLESVLNPLSGFTVAEGESIAQTTWRMTFLINWGLLLINLFPLYPFDVGLLLREFLKERFAEFEVRDLMIRLGLVVSVFGLLCGFVFDSSSLASASAFVLILHLHEAANWLQNTARAETFTGYEFSEFESVESHSAYENDPLLDDGTRTNAEQDEISRSGQQIQMQLRLEEERERQEFERRQKEERLVDEILRKLHVHGRDTLSPEELLLLQQAGRRYRTQRRTPSR